MSLGKKTVAGVVWSFLEKSLVHVIGLLTFGVLSRSIPATDFGIVAFAAVLIEFCQCMVSRGMADAIIQREEVQPIHMDTMFWGTVVLGIWFFGLIVFGTAIYELYFDNAQLKAVIQWLAFSLLIDSFGVTHDARFRRFMKFKELSICNVAARFASGLVGIIMALTGFGVWALVAQRLVYSSVRVVILFWISHWVPRRAFSWDSFVELFSFGLKVVGNSILSFLDSRMDVFFIGSFLGLTALGYYTIASKLLVLVWSIMQQALVRVLAPAFARLQSNRIELRRFFCRVLDLTSLIVMPLFIGGILLADELVLVVFGEGWEKSVLVMQIMFVGGIIYTTMGYLGVILTAIGRPGLLFKIKLVITIIRAFVFLLTAQMSIETVAAGNTLVAYLILLPLYTYFLCKVIPVPLMSLLRSIVRPVLSALLMASVVLIFLTLTTIDSQLLKLVSSIFIGALIYVGITVIVYRKELKMILGAVFKRKVAG